MRQIAFVNDGAEIHHILDHIGEASTTPKISQARSPPLWDACDETESVQYFNAGSDCDLGQYWPDEDLDLSVNW